MWRTLALGATRKVGWFGESTDFDEAYTLPYTNDLVRLGTSLVLALESNKLAISLEEGCTQILSGYTKGD